MVMGVLNLTPDSFSDGGAYLAPEAAWAQIDSMICHGAEIIDIGAESTRPGAEPVDAPTQIKRLAPIISEFKRRHPVMLSVDTTSATVAEFSLKSGADIINDISALRFEPNLAKEVAKWNAILVLNHSRHTPTTMQMHPHYTDVVAEVMDELRASIKIATTAGVKKIVVDPGIGFGKTLVHNLSLLRELRTFESLGYPIMIGTSRKSFISKITGETDFSRSAGTIASTLWALNNGATIARVHDVDEMTKALKVWSAIGEGAKYPI